MKNCSLCSNQSAVDWQGWEPKKSFDESQVGELHYDSFWVFKPQSDTRSKLTYSQQQRCAYENLSKRLINRKNFVPFLHNAKPHSARFKLKKKLNLGLSFLPHLISIFFFISMFRRQKLFSVRSSENVSGKRFELENSWIFLERNHKNYLRKRKK